MTSINSSVLAELVAEVVTRLKLRAADDVGISALHGILGIGWVGWFFFVFFPMIDD
jgi:hypothetical protein